MKSPVCQESLLNYFPEIVRDLFGNGVAFSPEWIYNNDEIPWDNPWNTKIDLE
jgi:hypothetical protein